MALDEPTANEPAQATPADLDDKDHLMATLPKRVTDPRLQKALWIGREIWLLEEREAAIARRKAALRAELGRLISAVAPHAANRA